MPWGSNQIIIIIKYNIYKIKHRGVIMIQQQKGVRDNKLFIQWEKYIL